MSRECASMEAENSDRSIRDHSDANNSSAGWFSYFRGLSWFKGGNAKATQAVKITPHIN